MAIAIALILLVIGTVLFHFLSPWWFTPIASNWQMMDDTVHVTFWVTGIVFVAVNLFLAYAVIRYRHRAGGEKAHYEPENKKLEWWLTIVTSVGIAAMLAPGLSVWAKFVTVPDEAAEVEVLGQQWNWSYRLPGKDEALGKTDIRFVSIDNPFGMDPGDQAGQDDVLVASPELHLPLDKPVKMLLRSKDVNHQFAVPQFRVKMDVVPGMVTYFWLTPTRTGSFDALCEQLCGMAHFAMRGRVVVDEQKDYDTWLAAQPTFSKTQAELTGNAETGKTLFATCTTCHGAQAEGNRELNAPKLSGQGKWYLAQQLRDFRNGVRGTHENDIYGKQMAPFAAMLADDTAIRDVVEYIASLEEARPPASVLGDPERGKTLYATCANCHGTQGQGIWATNAPRLANMSDWYMQRQMQNFREGIRGKHPQDFRGAQMASMAKVLADEKAISDVLDYVHTL
ncbi:cytochrome c oxidase subunit 2 [Povalibacter uvarum]|uniref:cytochrome-c oxidase n=1 Tax=Povalibacter uvarum TaxID=732238 RepID=A0A841HLD4_9GAMM|nr:c-type cytochrome [Povalibacter uvarum]MBB6093100.1 cytochrome c oxidase subunit 2 [Povalibacter uvarum]